MFYDAGALEVRVVIPVVSSTKSIMWIIYTREPETTDDLVYHRYEIGVEGSEYSFDK